MDVYTGPGEAPGDVRAEVQSSTEISVQWNGLSNCRLVNGRIIGYRVMLVTCCTAETRDVELGDGEDWRSRGEMVLTGLTPDTNYSISVAAVNEKGDIGLYSDPVTTMTHQCRGINNHTTPENFVLFHPPVTCSIENNRTHWSLSSTGIVGVVTGLIGVAVGIFGLIVGGVIAKGCRYILSYTLSTW